MVSLLKNPILIHELRERIRNRHSFLLLSAFVGVIALMAWLNYTVSFDNASSASGQQSQLGINTLRILLIMMTLILMFVAGILAAHSITNERQHQTIDLLLTTQLSYTEIIIGKTLATLAFCGLLLASVSPLMAITFLIGGVDVGMLLITYSILIAYVVCYTTIGVYWSTRLAHGLAAMGATVATIITTAFVIPLVGVFVFEGMTDIREGSWVALIRDVCYMLNPIVLIITTIERILQNNVWSDSVTTAGTTFTFPAVWLWMVMGCWVTSFAITLRSISHLAPYPASSTSKKESV